MQGSGISQYILMKQEKGSTFNRFRPTFPKAYTQWDAGLETSISCRRIVTYDFGGLQCLVIFSCDGYRASYKNTAFGEDVVNLRGL